jgi:hypothetical protein
MVSIMAKKRLPPSDHIVCRHCGKAYRAIMAKHLRRKHGYDGEHPVIEYKQSFKIPVAACGETRKLIRDARNEFWEERDQHWTRKRVVAEIRRRHRNGQCLRRNKVPHALHDAEWRLFGTWRAAIKKAGLNYDDIRLLRKWSQKKVIRFVQELAAENVPISSKHIKEHYPFLYSAGIKKFPRSWSKVLRAAGFEPEKHKAPQDKWDARSAEEWVRDRLANEEPVLARDAPSKLFQFVREQLKLSWVEFLATLGVCDHGSHAVRKWSSVKVISEIQRWNAEGQALNSAAMVQIDQSLVIQARKFFGSWDTARAAAGV